MITQKNKVGRGDVLQQLLLVLAGKPGSNTPSLVGRRRSGDWTRSNSDVSGTPNEQIISIGLHHFVGEFSAKLTENHASSWVHVS